MEKNNKLESTFNDIEFKLEFMQFAKRYLRAYGVDESEIDRITRWDLTI